MSTLLQAPADIADAERALADNLLAAAPDDAQLTHLLCNMLVRAQFGAAYLVAQRQIARGVWHPAIFLAQALGGLLHGNEAAAANGRAALHAATDAMTAEQQATFYTLLVKPAVPRVLEKGFFGGDVSMTLRLLQIVTAASPCLRPVFDLSASVTPLDIDAMRRHGAERARLMTMVPAPPTPRRQRRAVVITRDRVFSNIPTSRQLDIGPHIHQSALSYGWASTFRGMLCQDIAVDFQTIATLCEQNDADVLILDDQMSGAELPRGRSARSEMFRRLRWTMPSLQIVGLYMDAWFIEPDALRAAATDVDVVWSPSPAQPVWQEAAIAPKCFLAPFTYDIADDRPSRELVPTPFFAGGVMDYNWHRAFWLTAAAAAGLPIQARLSAHVCDGLSALESWAVYMRELADATCAINFSMRPNLSRIATGRSFETCLAGSLLIQESAPDMDYYFVAGEHYLAFKTFAELRAILQFLSDRPDEAEAIRRRGATFARERYSDHSVIGSLDSHLSRQAKSGAA